jgi:sulfate adenylyltransferase subunit 1 (EFTu-like GTPase family)
LEQNAMTCSAIVPVSASQGANLVKRSSRMPWYKGPILYDLLKSGFKKKAHANFRMPVQDSYSIDNNEFLVGAILGGAIKIKDQVHILPSGRKCSVRSLRTFISSIPRVSYPQSIGVQLEGAHGIGRGQVICKPPLPQAGNEIRVKIFCVAPLKAHEPFTLRCASQEVAARLVDIGAVLNIDDLKPKDLSGKLEPGDIAEATIRSATPIVYDSLFQNNTLSRFIIHQHDGICAFGLMGSKRS